MEQESSGRPALGHHLPAGEPYWSFQTYETLVFFGQALAISACTVSWLRRLA